jgi:hypothetical protein
VGGIGIRIGVDVHRQTAELGYWLGQEFWGRGIMTEAVAAFTDFCFEEFQLRRIHAEPFANNPASARVLEKAGFAFEGTHPEQRAQKWRASRFTSVRADKVTPACRRLACLLNTGDMPRLIKPMISFIVPAYNEEHELSDTLAAIRKAASGATQPYEIIVVDDASTDTTPEIASVAGAKVIPINRRQIAASRNAGGRAAQGEYLLFVDADTRINQAHVTGAIAALDGGYSGGSAWVGMDGSVPIWGRMLWRGLSFIYFGMNLGAGAFLFTTQGNFYAVGGFDEQYFAGEEVYFTMALKKLGRFTVLREPVVTSGRKLRMYRREEFLREFFGVLARGPRGVRSRAKLGLWYNGKRERRPV